MVISFAVLYLLKNYNKKLSPDFIRVEFLFLQDLNFFNLIFIELNK